MGEFKKVFDPLKQANGIVEDKKFVSDYSDQKKYFERLDRDEYYQKLKELDSMSREAASNKQKEDEKNWFENLIITEEKRRDKNKYDGMSDEQVLVEFREEMESKNPSKETTEKNKTVLREFDERLRNQL